MREVRYEVDGETVSGALSDPPGKARGALLLVHGFLSQRGEFADAAERLAALGWRVLAIDQRGFGASGGPRGRVSGPRAIADVRAGLRFLEKEHPGEPLGLVGHSMGACFALGAMVAEGERERVVEGPTVKAAVLCAPMRGVRAEVGELEFAGYKVARAASNLAERLGLGPISVPYKYREKHLFVDKEAVRRAVEARFLGKTINLANFNDLLAMDSTQHAREVRQPVLVVLADQDRAVKHASSRAVYDALAGPKEIVTVRSGHSMFGDLSAADVVGHVDRWMGAHLR